MAIFLPTNQNICVLKSILMGDFEMKSGHASEAIAALIGFRSHAAFLITSDHLSGATVYGADFEAFEARAEKLGYDRASSAHLRSIFKSIAWPEPAWRLFRKRDHAARSAWFYECERRKIPFLLISKATKYCAVEWDHITLDSEYDNMVRRTYPEDLGRVLFRNYQMLCRGVEPKSFFEGSSSVGKVTGLSEPTARQIANSFAQFLFPGNLRRIAAA